MIIKHMHRKDRNSNFFVKVLKITLLIHFVLFSGISVSAQYITERPSWAGLWFNLNNDPRDVRDMGIDFAGISGRQLWRNLEPQKGVYDFSAIKRNLEAAEATDSYWYFVLWTGPHSPDWLYDIGVPLVETDDRPFEFPYYLNEDYQKYIVALFDTLAATIAGYGSDLTKRLAFVQPGFGSTGDRQLYKGTLLSDPQYYISRDEYVDFMQKMTIAFTSAFERHESTSDVMFLWNIDDYDGSDPGELVGRGEGKQGEMLYGAWMKENYNCQLRKQQFTIAIGYMTPNEKDQDNEQRDHFFGNTGRWGGNPEFVRGEFNDTRWADIPRAKLNQILNYYWTSIASVDRGLDGWELKELHDDYKEAAEFSHRYSFYKRAETSPVAFIALRDVLDYSDTSRFPESEYGEASRTNQTRIDNILEEYESYGARNDDNHAVRTFNQSQYLLEATGYNDCTWNVIARNYRRFITQIDPNETSAGYWRVGITQDQPYGRFARGFDVEEGKNTMYFDVDDNYFLGNQMEDENNLKVKIIYYAEEEGSWELQYHATDDTMKKALEVNNEVRQGWLSKEVMLEDALLNNGGPRGADLVLQNTGGTNVKFHLIELERDVVKIVYDSIRVEGVSIDSCPVGEVYDYSTIQLSASVIPSIAGDQSVTWSSSNPEVATVDTTGLVRTLSEGNATITVTTNDGGFTDVCELEVKHQVIPVYGITIGDCPTGLLQTGDTHQLTANVAPENATDKSVTWSSSNTQVATVDSDGLVTAISEGSVTITATTNDGGFTRTCTIGIMSTGVSVTGVTLSGCPAGILEIDSTYQLTAHVAPSDAGDLRVSWSSSDETVATVNEDGWITPLSAGEATITVTTSDGGFTDECIISVGTVSGINEFDDVAKSFKIYPNPVSDELFFEFSKDDSEKIIRIYNLYGQLLTVKNTSESNFKIDIRNFKAGNIFFTHITVNGITSIKKIVVN